MVSTRTTPEMKHGCYSNAQNKAITNSSLGDDSVCYSIGTCSSEGDVNAICMLKDCTPTVSTFNARFLSSLGTLSTADRHSA